MKPTERKNDREEHNQAPEKEHQDFSLVPVFVLGGVTAVIALLTFVLNSSEFTQQKEGGNFSQRKEDENIRLALHRAQKAVESEDCGRVRGAQLSVHDAVVSALPDNIITQACIQKKSFPKEGVLYVDAEQAKMVHLQYPPRLPNPAFKANFLCTWDDKVEITFTTSYINNKFLALMYQGNLREKELRSGAKTVYSTDSASGEGWECSTE